MHTDAVDIVADPVGHISISGVHGRDELNERLANAAPYEPVRNRPIAALAAGVALGALLVYLLKR